MASDSYEKVKVKFKQGLNEGVNFFKREGSKDWKSCLTVINDFEFLF